MSFRKPDGRRQGHVTKDLVVIEGGVAAQEVPEAPKGLLKAQRDGWTAFWLSPASSLVLDADRPALQRLFLLRDEWARCLRQGRQEGRMVEGSTGQPALNPLYRHMTTLEAAIDKLEGQFGLNPLARLKMGVAFGEARKSITALNSSVEADDDGEELFGDIIDASEVCPNGAGPTEVSNSLSAAR